MSLKAIIFGVCATWPATRSGACGPILLSQTKRSWADGGPNNRLPDLVEQHIYRIVDACHLDERDRTHERNLSTSTDKPGDNDCRPTIFRPDYPQSQIHPQISRIRADHLTNDNQRVGSEAVFDDDARPSGHAALNDFPQCVRHL